MNKMMLILRLVLSTAHPPAPGTEIAVTERPVESTAVDTRSAKEKYDAYPGTKLPNAQE
jgi:hypothetical protein